MSRDFGGRVSTEMEFDFDARGETFVTTDKVRGVILAHLNKREVEPAARLIATSAPDAGRWISNDRDPRPAGSRSSRATSRSSRSTPW